MTTTNLLTLKHRSAASAILVGLTALAAIAGCGSGASTGSGLAATSGGAASSSTGPTATSSSPVETARQQAIAAYLGMWQSMADAANTSDWQSPRLPRYATGAALSTLTRGLYADHYNGLVTRGRPVNHPRVSSVDPSKAPTKVLVADCGDSTHWLKYRADNGQPADDGSGGRREINAIVQKQPDGMWKVSDFGVRAVGTC